MSRVRVQVKKKKKRAKDKKKKMLGVLGLKARDLIGFSFVQLLVHTPLVLALLLLPLLQPLPQVLILPEFEFA